jgi:hypothetical protein
LRRCSRRFIYESDETAQREEAELPQGGERIIEGEQRKIETIDSPALGEAARRLLRAMDFARIVEVEFEEDRRRNRASQQHHYAAQLSSFASRASRLSRSTPTICSSLSRLPFA